MPMLTRRQLLQSAGAGAAALLLAPAVGRAQEKGTGFTLPKLPYAFDALEPHIDAKTMEIHHDRHHAAYVNNLNTALKGHPDLLKKDIRDLIRDLNSLPKDVQTAVRNNGGGHLNHTMFWEMMAPKAGGMPKGDVAKAIDQTFGSFEKFQAAFADAAAKRFGSGWAWLVVNKGKLEVVSTANQDSPVTDGKEPILGIDVWEHAYYLKFQNRRPDYVKAWWNVVNWDDVAKRYKTAQG
jgi:superoxide dismutase, Fe-Mn family